MLYEFKEFWRRAFDFSGRTTRREYWVSYLLTTAIAYILIGLAMLLTGIGIANDHMLSFIIPGILIMIVALIYSLVLLIPCISICVRRCHDIDLSGWIYLACMAANCLCGIGSIAWLVICSLDSKPDNKYGTNPKDNPPKEYQKNTSIIISIIVFIISIMFYMASVIFGSIVTS